MALKIIDLTEPFENSEFTRTKKHSKCKGYYEEWSGEYDCGYYTSLPCDECKYGFGNKDPEAKRNQI